MEWKWSNKTRKMRDGARAERFVARRMQRRGFAILARNFVWRGGELDLVARRGELIVIMEVRYRRNESRIRAKETVNQRKQQRIIQGARTFLRRRPELARCSVRFDVAGVSREGLFLTCDWVENAFCAPANHTGNQTW